MVPGSVTSKKGRGVTSHPHNSINNPGRSLAALRVAVLLVGAILAVAVLPGSASAASSSEDQLVDLINAERSSRGLNPLNDHSDLTAAAEDQAEAIAAAGYLFHNQDLGSITSGWEMMGENVGYGGSVASVHDALMNSPGHRANILNPGYTHVGVGVVVSGGSVWVAEVFMDSVGPAVYEGTFWDDDASVHHGSIEWLAQSGITMGCSPIQYCPLDTVTRGQMAAFIQRAMGLKNGTGSTYSDTGGSIFAGAIEALADAGIAEPCASGRYCPDAPMTREMMAVFLSRALDLPASSEDRFVDDDNSRFEAEIQALARSGITVGCSETQYCPNDSVTREQMATFLMRSWG
jgi:uncharacterized protein YkwD